MSGCVQEGRLQPSANLYGRTALYTVRIVVTYPILREQKVKGVALLPFARMATGLQRHRAAVLTPTSVLPLSSLGHLYKEPRIIAFGGDPWPMRARLYWHGRLMQNLLQILLVTFGEIVLKKICNLLSKSWLSPNLLNVVAWQKCLHRLVCKAQAADEWFGHLTASNFQWSSRLGGVSDSATMVDFIGVNVTVYHMGQKKEDSVNDMLALWLKSTWRNKSVFRFQAEIIGFFCLQSMWSLAPSKVLWCFKHLDCPCFLAEDIWYSRNKQRVDWGSFIGCHAWTLWFRLIWLNPDPDAIQRSGSSVWECEWVNQWWITTGDLCLHSIKQSPQFWQLFNMRSIQSFNSGKNAVFCWTGGRWSWR